MRQQVIVWLLQSMDPMRQKVIANLYKLMLQLSHSAGAALPDTEQSFSFPSTVTLDPCFLTTSTAPLQLDIRRQQSQPVPLLASSFAQEFETKFEKLALLGEGGFGKVWRCRHKLDGQEYAVKAVTYSSAWPNGATAIEQRVEREAQIWAAMDHPNVVRYHTTWVEIDVPDMGSWQSNAGDDGSPIARTKSVPMMALKNQAARGSWSQDSFGDDSGGFSYDGSMVSDGGLVVFDEPRAFSIDGITEREAGSDGSHSPEFCFSRSPDMAEEHGGSASSNSSPKEDMGREIVLRNGNGTGLPKQPTITLNKTLYVQMELCSNETLASWIRKRNQAYRSKMGQHKQLVWLRDTCDIFEQCVSAVAHLHAHGCAHRDVKPPNIFFGLNGKGGIRLGDFGLAKALGSYDDSPSNAGRLKALGSISSPSSPDAFSLGSVPSGKVGTPTYASPEQLAGAACDVQTDVYSLGIILAELLCPLETDTAHERLELLTPLKQDGKMPETQAASFPKAASLVLAMLRQEPKERPTAKEVLQSLADVRKEVVSASAVAVSDHYGTYS